MRVVNSGSINLDHVYLTPHFVRPGESLFSENYQKFYGGKGLNQSIALTRAGAEVYHAGRIGKDGLELKEFLSRSKIITENIMMTEDEATGHAIIQINKDGENQIIVYSGANKKITKEDIDRVLSSFSSGDLLLVQNEISNVGYIIERGAELGLKVVLNPAPMTEEVKNYSLEKVDYFIINEIEGAELTGQTDLPEIQKVMRDKYPGAAIVLTCGEKGVLFSNAEEEFQQEAYKVKAVDTTAAGDTFIGFFIAEIMNNRSIRESLDTACMAAAICVTKMGAANSIPKMDEVKRYKF